MSFHIQKIFLFCLRKNTQHDWLAMLILVVWGRTLRDNFNGHYMKYMWIPPEVNIKKHHTAMAKAFIIHSVVGNHKCSHKNGFMLHLPNHTCTPTSLVVLVYVCLNICTIQCGVYERSWIFVENTKLSFPHKMMAGFGIIQFVKNKLVKFCASEKI